MLKVKKVMGCKNNDNFFRIYVHKTKKHKKKSFVNTVCQYSLSDLEMYFYFASKVFFPNIK